MNLSNSGLYVCLALNALGFDTVYYNVTVLPRPQPTEQKTVEVELHVPLVTDETYYLLSGVLVILFIGIIACWWCCRTTTQAKASKSIIFQKQIIVNLDENSNLTYQNSSKRGADMSRDSAVSIELAADSLAPEVHIEGRHVEVDSDKLEYYKQYMFKFPNDPRWEIAKDR